MFCVVFFASELLQTKLLTNANVVNINLEAKLPKAFDEWKLDERIPVIDASQVGGLENLIYSQIVSRTYYNKDNKRVMLSIAYGPMQRDNMQVHFPDVCYPAQGFEILKGYEYQLYIHGQSLNAKQLVTKRGMRNELVTYWVKVGDRVVNSRFQQKLYLVRDGLVGKNPDGLLFRISTVNETEGSQLQQEFINELFDSISEQTIEFLVPGVI